MSGVADVTSVYKRNAAHIPLAIHVLSSFEITVFDCCLERRQKGKGRGKSTRRYGRKPNPRKNPKVTPQVSSSSSLQAGEEAPKEGGQHSPTVSPRSRPVSSVDNQSSSSCRSYEGEPLKPATKQGKPAKSTDKPAKTRTEKRDCIIKDPKVENETVQ